MEKAKSKKTLIVSLIVIAVIATATIGILAFRMPHKLSTLVKTDNINRVWIEKFGEAVYEADEDLAESILSDMQSGEFRFAVLETRCADPVQLCIEYNDGSVVKLDSLRLSRYGSDGKEKGYFTFDLMTLDISKYIF